MRSTFTTEQKAAAVAALLSGDTEAHVAAKFGAARRTVRTWRAQLLAHAAQPGTALVDRAAPAVSLDTLVASVVELLEHNLKALRAIDGTAQDPKWLRKQDAHQLAVLYGVIADKTHRWLAALQAGNGDAG